MRSRVPANLLRRTSLRALSRVHARRREEAERWRLGLDAEQRRELAFGARSSLGRLERIDEAGAPGPDEEVEGAADFFEYAAEHDLVMVEGRPFRICKAHPAARAVARR